MDLLLLLLSSAACAEQLGQVSSCDVLHDNDEVLLVLSVAVHTDYEGMVAVVQNGVFVVQVAFPCCIPPHYMPPSMMNVQRCDRPSGHLELLTVHPDVGMEGLA